MKTRMLGSVTRSWSCMGSDHKAHALSTRWPHSGGSLVELAVPFTCSQVQGLFSPISVSPVGVLCSRGKEAGSLPVQRSPGAPVCPPQPGWALLLHRRPLASYRPRSSIAQQPPGAAPTISQVSVICLLLANSLKLPQAAIIFHLALVSLICSPNFQGEHINQQSCDFPSLLGVCCWCPLSLPHRLPT